MRDFAALVDVEGRRVDPTVFVDEEVYRAEQSRIFGRCWLFVAHESQLARPGDFLTTTMGEESVIATRDPESRLRVFLNSCRHRGARVCRVDRGHTRMFHCPYHGWSYDTRGKLRGVPQLESAYHGDLDLDAWGLIEVPRVESFCGLIFACFNAEAQPLRDYLSEIGWYLELILRRTAGGTYALPGVHRWILPGNWKLAAEQFAGDNYHTGALHQSMVKIGLGPSGDYRGDDPWRVDFQVKSRNGHGWINFKVPMAGLPPAVEAYIQRTQREARATLTPEQAELVHCAQVGGVFPNFAILAFLGFVSIRVWHPRGLGQLHVWSYALADRDAPTEVVEFARRMQTLTFSSSGIFEQDDGCIWGDMFTTLSGRQRRRHPLNYQMGAGHARELDDRPGLIHPPPTEIGIFGFHEYWRELMSRPD